MEDSSPLVQVTPPLLLPSFAQDSALRDPLSIGCMIPPDLLLADVGHRGLLPRCILHDCAIRVLLGMRLLLGRILGEPDQVREPLA